MTANDIISDAFKLFDELSGGKYEESGSRTFALMLLNEGYFEICKETQCAKTTATLVTVPGTAEYSLPSDFVSMLEVGMDVNMRFLSPIYFKNLNYKIQGFPKAYYIQGSKIGFDVIPDNSYTMVEYYHQVPTADLTLTDEPTLIPEAWQKTLKYYIVMRLFMTDKEADPGRISIWQQTYNEKLAKMKNYFAGDEAFAGRLPEMA